MGNPRLGKALQDTAAIFRGTQQIASRIIHGGWLAVLPTERIGGTAHRLGGVFGDAEVSVHRPRQPRPARCLRLRVHSRKQITAIGGAHADADESVGMACGTRQPRRALYRELIGRGPGSLNRIVAVRLAVVLLVITRQRNDAQNQATFPPALTPELHSRGGMQLRLLPSSSS